MNWQNKMDWHRMVERAYEIDLEEISLLANAARTAPIEVSWELLKMISSEVMDAGFWLTLLATRQHCMPPCPSPFSAEGDTENKEEED